MKPVSMACKEVFATDRVLMAKISYVVADKHPQTRLNLVRPINAKRNGNPKPGTIIDRGIPPNIGQDFCSIAYSSIQRTAQPVHCFVIHDGVSIGVHGLERRINPRNCSAISMTLTFTPAARPLLPLGPRHSSCVSLPTSLS